ncbi:hypothetical protein U9M48_031775 [Paspalum notatum var. saurae]|uniref:Uncharacterized protein n=1 Tax=Paspalum notatum var. saurae TaxID=547442 RepID=A0AAQ3X4Q0_PASNO
MGQVRPRRRFPKVSRFLTSKPGVQRRIGLLATWRTSEDCVEAKKIKSSSWSSIPDISVLSSKFRRVRVRSGLQIKREGEGGCLGRNPSL